MENNVQDLIRISESKQKLLLQMLDLTQQQSEAIAAEDAELLQELTEQRQNIIQAVDILDKQFAAGFDVLKRSLGITSLQEVSPARMEGCGDLKAVVGDIMDLLGEINELDTENTAKAQELLEGISQEIQKLNKTKRVQNAYKAPKIQPSAHFFDKKQ